MAFPNRNFITKIPGYNTMNGVVKPPFAGCWSAEEARSGTSRKKPKGRFIAPTAYSFFREAWQDPIGTARYERAGTVNIYSGCLSPYGAGAWPGMVPTYCNLAGAPTSVAPALRARALSVARGKLKSNDFNAPVAVGELAATASMFENAISSISKAARAYRRRDWKGVCKSLGCEYRKPAKSAASFMLTYSYGVVPLLLDVHGAAKALEESPADRWITTVKAGSRQQYDREVYYMPVSGSGSLDFSSARVKVTSGSFVRIDASPVNPGLIKMAQLGITNPLAVAWELTTLSFVADWFYPVGDFLNGLDATLGWEIKGFSQSDYIRINISASGVSNLYMRSNVWSSHYEKISLNRTVSSSVPFPILTDLRGKLTGRRIANGLSLLRVLAGPK